MKRGLLVLAGFGAIRALLESPGYALVAVIVSLGVALWPTPMKEETNVEVSQ